MDGWLKVLVATTCVVIIAGAGYFASKEYQANKAQIAASDRVMAADRLTTDYCNGIARRTLPDRSGQQIKTDAFIVDLNACDDRNRIDPYLRQQLDMIGVF